MLNLDALQRTRSRAGRKFKLTDEQEYIIGSDHDNMVIDAGAGASKTHTLVEYALSRPNERMLYLAFNRSIKEEAQLKFPKNVTVMTSHSPAFRAIGAKYAEKLSGSMRPYDVIRALNLKQSKVVPSELAMLYAKRLVESLNNFLTTVDEFAGPQHMTIDRRNQREVAFFKPVEMANQVNKLWEMMVDVKNKTVPMLHDGYLKLFMLSGMAIGRYHRILFDEAQDANPVTIGILKNQPSKKIYVGDKNQAIYGFRGAVDALASIKDSKRFMLSNSFRFGPEIALAANRLLYLKDSDMYVSGAAAPGHVHIARDRNAYHSVLGDQRCMMLARGNFMILEKALNEVQAGKKVHFIGGAQDYRFNNIDDIYYLRYDKSMVNDDFISLFEDYEELKTYSENDREIAACVRMVDLHKQDLLNRVKKINESIVPKDEAQVVFSTVHKAKGLEEDHVVMLDDFQNLSMGDHYFNGQQKINDRTEESNIAYVAMTRAKKTLVLPPDATDLYLYQPLTRQVIAAAAAANTKSMEILDEFKREIRESMGETSIAKTSEQRQQPSDETSTPLDDHKKMRRTRRI